jgi:Glycosyltransferase family 87
MAAPIERLIDRLPAPTAALVRERLAIDAFLVVGAVFVAFRLFSVGPYTLPILDMHAYWATRDGISYAGQNPFLIGAYLYAPAFAQAIAPLTTLPYPIFAAAWASLSVVVLAWLVGRWALAILFSLAVALELYLGQIDILLAAAIVISFRYPAAWAFPLLTKVAPGVGLVWYLVRREWRNLAVAITATVAIAAVSALISPEAWRGWFDLLRRSVADRQTIEGAYIAIPIGLRLPSAIALIAWGALGNRRWTVPVGVLLAMPILWGNVFTLLVAVVALRPEPGLTPARNWLLRGRTFKPRPMVQAEPGPSRTGLTPR